MTILLDYMERRLQKEEKKQKSKPINLGPVITISREYGCRAKVLAQTLTDEINKKVGYKPDVDEWKWIGKEILDESAKELKIKRELVQEIGEKKDQSLLQDILLSFGNKYYPGDIKIRRTIGEVIHSFAEKGNTIIVGRGGASICKDIPKSLHVRLIAPLDWRINEISKMHNISVDDAEKMISDIDKKRERLLEYFEGRSVDHYMFDIIFNYMNVTQEEAVTTIMKFAELRNLI